MSLELDQQLLQDFLTETGELIEQLDRDLVALEGVTDPAQRSELLNSVFRALHTVKGAAGFLKLEPVIRFAHAAEDALNRLRKGEVAVTPPIMDAMLASVDVLRSMTDALSAGNPIPECPPPLIVKLRAITEGASSAPATEAASSPSDAPAAASSAPAKPTSKALDLSESKRDLLPYFISDLHQSVDDINNCITQMTTQGADVSARLGELAGAVEQTAGFFELDGMNRIAATFKTLIAASPIDAVAVSEIAQALSEQAHGLEAGEVIDWHPATSASAESTTTTPAAVDSSTESTSTAKPAEVAAASDSTEAAASGDPKAARRATPTGEQTIRVDVDRLETLLNLVGQLVLTKNRMLGISRHIQSCTIESQMLETVRETTNELDRLTGELQRSVMRTRLQPMAKLFDRYPRLIRDLSRSTGKQIELRIVGKDTEVDKTVLELLADPLIHIMRNSADHGIETPDVRTAAGKPALGIITLTAEHQGNHVRVEVTDDGKGIHADVIGRKAVEKGLVTAEELSQMSEPQIQALVFAPGFSTAEKLSDLSGRGVGMDVVRTNVVKMNGTINVRSTAGKGTCVEILIPLTVAILPAMMVGVGDTLYALPLTSILEIVRPTPEMLHSVNSRPVLQLRNTVMPLIDLRQRLDHQTSDGKAPFAVVVACGAQRAGLIVDRLIGQQEVVIKPLDEAHAGGPFSGATIREDGGVSLILDIALLLHPRKANGHEPLGRAA